MSGCHAPCDTDSNNSFFDGNEEMGVRFPPTQLIRISVLKPNMERWRNGRRGSYVQYVMFVALTAIYYSLGACFIDGSNPSLSIQGDGANVLTNQEDAPIT